MISKLEIFRETVTHLGLGLLSDLQVVSLPTHRFHQHRKLIFITGGQGLRNQHAHHRATGSYFKNNTVIL